MLGKSTRDVNHVVECFYLAMEKSHLSRGGRSNVAVLLDGGLDLSLNGISYTSALSGIDMMDESETNFDIWLPYPSQYGGLGFEKGCRLYFPSTIRFVLSCPVMMI